MKLVQIDKYNLIEAGNKIELKTGSQLNNIVKFLERQEQYIHWLQPKSGAVQDQIPAVNINDKYYHLNLKMEKAVFRNVRLHRNFQNLEMLQNGKQKLRIPVRLYREKQRTSKRVLVREKNVLLQNYEGHVFNIDVCAGNEGSKFAKKKKTLSKNFAFNSKNQTVIC